MGPLVTLWPFSHRTMKRNTIKKCLIKKMINKSLLLSLNLALLLLIVQSVFNFNYVTAVPTEGETSSESIDSADYKSYCGKRLWKEPEGRIVGGTNAKFADWPWVVSIRHNKWVSGEMAHGCGASLITQYWLLTAAHCVDKLKASDLVLRFGELDISKTDEPLPHVDVEAEKIEIHPDYSDFIVHDDIAMIKLKHPVTFKDHIVPVCIPEQYTNYTGHNGYVVGWGSTYEGGPMQDALKEVEVPIISNYECSRRYMKTGIYKSNYETFVCAGNEDGLVDACQGDSGGPLMVQRDSDQRFEQIGVVSWGYGCGAVNRPGAYSLVSHYLSWINEKINS